MKTRLNQILLRSAGLLLLAIAQNSYSATGIDTWTGGAGTVNWSDAGNWTGVNAPPLAGDTPTFGTVGAGGAALNMNLAAPNTNFLGLTFNADAPSFVLNGGTINSTGGIVDNSTNLQTVNLPIIFTSTHSLSAASGGKLLLGGVLSGAGGATKTGGGTVTLSNANTYSGITAVNAGTLTLDFSLGTPAANIINPASVLNLGGGTLNIGGNASASSSQTFASTTFTPGNSVINAAPVSGANNPTLALGALTFNQGGAIRFNGPATQDAAGNPVAATATITTTSVGGGAFGLIRGTLFTGNNPSQAGYGTVGLFDWASTSLADGTAGASPYTVLGGSQVAGFYTTATFAAGNNFDMTANFTTATGNPQCDTVRFNTPTATTMTERGNFLVGGFLVTPNMGANNASILIGANGGPWQVIRNGGGTTDIQEGVIWQNNTLGYFTMNPVCADGRDSNDINRYVKAGNGTVFFPAVNTYRGATYINGGNLVITSDSGVGAPATATAVILNGGTLFGNATFTLDNGGTNSRPVNLIGNGGGLAAAAGTAITVNGLITGVAGTGPLTIGISASGANGNVPGLLPGSGPGTANTVPVYATGTVILSNTNTYVGGILLASGVVNINATETAGISGPLGASGTVSFNGGALQYSAVNTFDYSSRFSTSAGQAYSIDTGGQSVTLASALTSSGATLVKSGAGTLTLNAAATYSGATAITAGTLALGASGSINSTTNLTIASGAVLDTTAAALTLGSGQTLTAGRSSSPATDINGNLSSSGTIVVGGAGTYGTLTENGNLSLTGGVVKFELTANPGSGNDQIALTGTGVLNLSGTTTIDIQFSALSVGTYHLMTYTGKTGVGTLTPVYHGNFGRLTPSFQINGTSVDLVLTGNPHTIAWIGDGSNNFWDQNTGNTDWMNILSSAADYFANGDNARFNNSGAANTTVVLNANNAPASTIVDSSSDYVFTGTGSISGGSLTKSNINTLTILTTNNLPGPIVVQGGILQVGDGITSGTIGAGTVTNNATLILNSPSTVAAGPITGTGDTTIKVGTLAIGGNSTLGSLIIGGSGTAGTLDLAGNSVTATALNLDPGAAGGFITNSGMAVVTNFFTINNAADSVYGGVISGNPAGSKVALVKTGSGTLALSGVNSYVGGTTIYPGVLALSQAAGIGTGMIELVGGTLSNTASLNLNGLNMTIATGNKGQVEMPAQMRLPNLYGGGTLALNVNGTGGSSSHYGDSFSACANFTGTLNITGIVANAQMTCYHNGGSFDGQLQNATVNLDNVSLIGLNGSAGNTAQFGTLNVHANAQLGGGVYAGFQNYQIGALNAVSDIEGNIVDGSVRSVITKVGTGNLIMAGYNTYTGATWVNGGTLTVLGTLTASPATNYSGGTVAGMGSLYSLDLELGSTVAPGVGGIGTLTCSSDLTFNGGTNLVDISSANRDLIVVGGALNLVSGTVRLVVSGTLSNGTYPLITGFSSLTGGAANLALLGFSQPGQIARLSDTTTGEIDLVVESPGGAHLTWASYAEGAASGIWNVGSAVNWTNRDTLSLGVFHTADHVTFDDNGAADNASVDLQAAVQPSTMVVTGTQAYVFSSSTGAGKISGATNSLMMLGTGSTEIDLMNDYGGITSIGSGYTLTVGNGNDAANLGTGNITNNGILIFNQTNNLTLTDVRGTGSLTKNGTNTLILAGADDYTGITTIGSQATLQVGTGGATGPLANTVTANGTLILNQSGSVAMSHSVAGAGTVIQNGSSTLIMNVPNTYQGNTYVNHGVLKLGASDVIPDEVSAAGSVGWFILDGNATNAGVFDLNGFNESVNLLQGLGGTVLGDITNSAPSGTSTLTFGNDFTATANGYAGLITENTAGGLIALVKTNTSANTLTGGNSFSGGTIVKGGTLTLGANTAAGSGAITLSNGVSLGLQQNGSSSVGIGNTIFTGPGMTATLTNSTAQPGNAFAGLFVSGDGNSTNVINGSLSISASAVKQFQSFTGTLQIPVGSAVRFSSSQLSTNGGDNTIFDIEGSLNTRNGQGAFGPGVSLGALTGSGNLNGAGNAAGSSIYVIGAKGIDSTFAGTIADTANGNVSIVKVGAGKLTLSGAANYTGTTTISNGVLALVDPVSLDSNATINVSSSTATLDVSGRSDGALNLGILESQTLNGIGNIAGTLNSLANSTVKVGLGNLNVIGAATLAGTNLLQLNRTNAITHSEMIATSFAISGPLVVQNVGPALQGGDTFQLFSAGVAGFTATNLPALSAGQYWTNKLALNGTIAVVSTVSTLPTNIITSVNGNVLTLSWPADHIGWRLQVQTNSLAAGMRTNWFDVPGSTLVNSNIATMNPVNGTVFYRMIYP